MPDHLTQLTNHIISQIHTLGFNSPRGSVIRALLDIAYFASLRTEEGRFIRGSLTYADPTSPDFNPPLRRRADYPSFTAFPRQERLTVEMFVKLSRAIDNWSGAIAVYGTKTTNLFVWGVVDQRVHENIRIHREGIQGFSNPGILTVTMEGVGAISVTHGDLFLCALRQNQIVTRENDVLTTQVLGDRILPLFSTVASQIALLLGDNQKLSDILASLFSEWSNAIARICIGLRRNGTGGSLLITPSPIMPLLDIVHPFPYRRLYESMILKVLDKRYLRKMQEKLREVLSEKTVPSKLVIEVALSEADEADRTDELTGAVKIVTSIASADGVVLLNPTLSVDAFGVKIRAGRNAVTVYDGAEFMQRGTGAKKIDVSNLGTRHGSMLRYCRADKKAVGIVVSQDGHVRMIASKGGSLVLWPNVMLLHYYHNVREYAREERRNRFFRNKHQEQKSFGYTQMPKSVAKLLAYRMKK